MSDTRWRQVVKGSQPGPAGTVVPARAAATSLARMAIAVGVSPEQLEEAGREDAAEQQRRMQNAPLLPGMADDQTDEISLVRNSRTMTTRQKLETIRTILQLRKQLEDEEAAAHGSAPAPDAEAGAEQQS
jgi:hypothetical protein